MSRILHISDEEILNQSQRIFRPIKYGESATVTCYPCCKIAYNLSCFLSSNKILRSNLGNLYKRFLFIPINFESGDDENIFIEKIFDFLKSQKKIQVRNKSTVNQICDSILNAGKEPYFFLLDAHQLKPEKLSKILTSIHSQILRLKRVGAIIFFESNIFNYNIASILEKNNKLLQNYFTISIYPHKESVKFINNIAKSWKIKLSKKMIDNLYKNFSGHLWLLREAIRQIREQEGRLEIKKIIDSPGIQLRLEAIYNNLTNEEKNGIAELCYGDNEKVSNKIKQYLLSVGIVSYFKNKFKLSLSVLEPYIKSRLISNELQLNKAGNKLFCKGIDISLRFSSQELQVIMLLISKRGVLITREEIAQQMWGKNWEDKYSEWAIDKLISRIRVKLQDLSINKNLLKTIKSRGFIIS